MHNSFAQLITSAGDSFIRGTLYVVATPIGNLADISARGIAALREADIICAEDTRVTSRLLSAYGISAHLVSLREHNEQRMAEQVIGWLQDGKIVVQVSDAGTPGISDPGARLAHAVWQAGLTVTPVPGCCAVIAALCASGVLAQQFLFAGFLAPKSGERRRQLAKWAQADYAVACYEAPHRIVDTLHDIVTELGDQRSLILVRELTKTFETILHLPAGEMLKKVSNDPNQQRGEQVLIIDVPAGEKKNIAELDEEVQRVTLLLAAELPTKQAAALAAQITGQSKKQLYDFILKTKS